MNAAHCGNTPQSEPVLILGGGLMGLAIAHQLARRGERPLRPDAVVADTGDAQPVEPAHLLAEESREGGAGNGREALESVVGGLKEDAARVAGRLAQHLAARRVRRAGRVTHALDAGQVLIVIDERLEQVVQLGPGDDPAAAAAGVRLRAQQSRDAQYLRNIEHARTWLDTTDRVLSDIGDLLGRARELAVQASTGTFTSGDTKQLAEEINAIRSQIISAVNGTVDVDQHVFSGQKSDITPLVLDANGNASYQGDTGVTIGTGTGAGSDLAPANGIPNVDNGIVQIAAASGSEEKFGETEEFSKSDVINAVNAKALPEIGEKFTLLLRLIVKGGEST